MGKIRVSVVANTNQKQKSLVLLDTDCAKPLQEIETVARNKLKIKTPKRYFVSVAKNSAYEITSDTELLNLFQEEEAIEVVISKGENYIGTLVEASQNTRDSDYAFNLIAKDSPVDDIAMKQVETTVKSSPFIFLASGMPDLHPGSVYPIGVTFLSQDDVVYPCLIGNDIGCGMSLYQMEKKAKSVKPFKLQKSLTNMEGSVDNWETYCRENIPNFSSFETKFSLDEEVNRQIGTIGGGNHFAELLAVDEIINESLLPKDFDKDRSFLLVHSGSRLLGQKVLDAFKQDTSTDIKEGVHVDSECGKKYLERHDYACQWAKANRTLIAKRFHECIECNLESSKFILDVWHNCVSSKSDIKDRSGVWLHRKGAAPSDAGYVVIPGSRGAHSYLVLPKNPDEHLKNGFSLAHGAGRKIARGKASAKIGEKIRVNSSGKLEFNEALRETPFQSAVICDDAELLMEEHQSAYKEIDDIVNDLVYFGVVDIVVKFRPLVTYKVRNVQ